MLEGIKAIIDSHFNEAIIDESVASSPPCLTIKTELIYSICELLHAHDQTYFDQLSCLTGIDNGPESGTMEVVYNLYSIPKNIHLMLKVVLDRKKPKVDSVHSIWRNANWYERETYDLLGIQFINHPDLRRILLPSDWEGYPLRKDYEVQKYYHGITVKYDRDKVPDDIPQIKK